MKGKKNFICKQFINLSYAGDIDAFTFRDQVSLLCTTKLLPALEKLMDEKSPKGKVFYFEKLQIDVGELPTSNWESVFVEKVIEQIRQLVSSPSSSKPEQHPYILLEDDEYNKNVMQEMNQLASTRQCIFHFLETGVLLWNSKIENKHDLRKGLEELVKLKDYRTQLLELCHSSNDVLQRLINQVDDDILNKILLLTGKINAQMLEELKLSLYAVMRNAKVSLPEKRQAIYETLLINIFKDGELATGEEYTRLACTLNKQIQLILKEKIIVSSNTDVLQITEVELNKDAAHRINFSKGASSVNFIEECFINNAGLVLLHPFLHTLFENVGYTDKKVWIGEGAMQRAVVLTQSLVTGKEEYPEFDLLLNKILVGYPIEKTLPVEIYLSDFEKQEAQDVLQSVIKHWTALKKTSVEGLQSTFLTRNGKLFIEDSSWNLKVEQKTVDILIDNLPWGFSMVKTPWMKTMLKVDWT
jgi:hypothetical protein